LCEHCYSMQVGSKEASTDSKATRLCRLSTVNCPFADRSHEKESQSWSCLWPYPPNWRRSRGGRWWLQWTVVSGQLTLLDSNTDQPRCQLAALLDGVITTTSTQALKFAGPSFVRLDFPSFALNRPAPKLLSLQSLSK